MALAAASVSFEGFLLTRQWQDQPLAPPFSGLRQCQLVLWLRTREGTAKLVVDNQRPVFFLASEEVEQGSKLLEQLFGRSASHPQVAPSWEIKPVQLKDFANQPVQAVYFREQRSLYRARDTLKRAGLTPLEADVNPTDRYLMERFVAGGMLVTPASSTSEQHHQFLNPVITPSDYTPQLSFLCLDIETSMDAKQLYSIGAVLGRYSPGEDSQDSSAEESRVFMCGEGSGPKDQDYLIYCANETQLLLNFLDWFERLDPDVIIGWNVINFDLRVLQTKADELGITLALGREKTSPDWRQSRDDDEHFTLLLPGRLVMDGIETMRSATYQFESFALDAVGKELLGRGKLSEDVDHRGEEITEQFLHDKPALARYNLEDCQLVWDIFLKADLINFGLERARLTGLAMDRFGGSVAAFDNRYLPRLHRRGFVAPALQENPVGVGSPGGYVMDSIPGFYQQVLVLDFKSLYPSIIRTFCIDPLARITADIHEQEQGGAKRLGRLDREETTDVDRNKQVPGFNGAAFLKDTALLPDIIGELWQARDQAKQQGRKAMSQAIKIIMNSFYGVLGTPGCRFFDYRLPSSITLRGHQVLTRSKELLEERGHRVIYGDTDSVFVHLQPGASESHAEIRALGQQLAADLNQWWRYYLQREYQLQSYLEIEFETHYSQFLMPTIRGTDTGSKKRYAGLIQHTDGEQELVFKGLEAVRSDWTPLARQFQRELYRRVFNQEDYLDYIQSTLAGIVDGELDDQLVFRKRIRRKLEDYQRNVPPHVQAARKADDWLQERGRPARYARGGWIRYVLTQDGPQPMECVVSPLDYDTFIERQIAPIVDGVVQFLGTSFAEITDPQIGLF